MPYQTSTGRFAERIFAYLNPDTEEKQLFSTYQELPLLHDIHRIFPQCIIMTCPVQHPQSRFVSANCIHILGYNSAYFTGNNSAQHYFSHLHPDDQEDVEACFSFIDAFLKQIIPADYHLYRCIFQYRFRHRDGSYIVLHDEKAVFKHDDGSRLYYSILKDISKDRLFSGVSLEIFRLDNCLQKVAEYKPATGRVRLSKRESELVGFIRNGFTTKEIAHKLSISHHTVRNIRQKMFEKYKVGNAIELLNITTHYN